MKKKFIKTPLVGVLVHGAKDVGTRTVNLLMGEHAGEYVRGDIMDANAVIQAFDELKGNVDNNHDSLEEIVNEIHNFRDTTNHRFDVFQEKAEEEIANRILGDNTLDDKIDQKETESNERDNVLQLNINTEKQERVNADTQLRNDLTAEVNRAKANENALSSDIHAEATKRENDDNTIKDNLNAEITRATAKENEIKAEVDVINGDSTTEGSFRKAIADVVGAAPEAYDTLKEIADKLNENDDLHTAINDAIATKATTVALNEEITRAKAAEAENKAEIAAESARAKEVEGDNALAIQNEASRATTAETAINESLNTEIDRAKGQEAYLQNLVNAKADTTTLDGAKAELDKKISDETTRATGVEATKASADDLTAEVTRAKLAEAAITSDVTEKLAQKADTDTLSNYALKTELPTVPTKLSQLTNDSNFITAADVDFTPYATTEALTAVEQKVDANTTAITNVTTSRGIPYDPSVTGMYLTDKHLAVKLNDTNTAVFGPQACIRLQSSGANALAIYYSGLELKSGDYTFNVNPDGIKQVGICKFDVNGNDGIKWCAGVTDNDPYVQMYPYGFNATIDDNAYTKCNCINGLDIKYGGPNSGSLTSLNHQLLLIKKSDDQLVLLTPELLLIKNDLTGAKLLYIGNRLVVLYGSDRFVELGPFANAASGGLSIHDGNEQALWIYPDRLIIQDGSGRTRDRITFDYDGITHSNDYISFTNHLIQGFDINLYNSNRKLSETIEDIYKSKQDKITPTAELDLTSIDTANIESLRSIVKALATELNTLGLIRLKSA